MGKTRFSPRDHIPIIRDSLSLCLWFESGQARHLLPEKLLLFFCAPIVRIRRFYAFMVTNL
jgi:hypothetical protein